MSDLNKMRALLLGSCSLILFSAIYDVAFAQTADAPTSSSSATGNKKKRHQRLYAGAPVFQSPAQDLRNHLNVHRQSGGRYG